MTHAENVSDGDLWKAPNGFKTNKLNIKGKGPRERVEFITPPLSMWDILTTLD